MTVHRTRENTHTHRTRWSRREDERQTCVHIQRGHPRRRHRFILPTTPDQAPQHLDPDRKLLRGVPGLHNSREGNYRQL